MWLKIYTHDLHGCRWCRIGGFTCAIQATQRSNDAQQSSATRFIPLFQPDSKTTTISFSLVRETSVSRHHGAQLMAPWNPHKLQHYRNEGHKGGPQLGPIVSRDTSLSDSNKSDRCYIFSLAFNVREDASSYNFQGHPVYFQF